MTTTEIGLEAELQDARPGSERRCGGFDALSWCHRAAGHLFHTAGGTPALTTWGIKAMRLLFLVLVERGDVVAPPMAAWLQEHVVPCVFSEAEGSVQTAHGDLSYALIQYLLQQCVAQLASSTVTEPPPPPAPTGRRGRKRRAP